MKIIRKLPEIIRNYLTVLVPISGLIIFGIWEFADGLGLILIDLFGPTLGLFVRPIAIGLIPITILGMLLLKEFKTLNYLIWFKRLDIKQIHFIYKSYIYALGSFVFLTLCIVITTLFAYSEKGVNWYTTKDYLFFYLVLLLIITPIPHTVSQLNNE